MGSSSVAGCAAAVVWSWLVASAESLVWVGLAIGCLGFVALAVGFPF